MRLDIESKQLIEPYSSLPNTQLLTSLVHIIENEFSHLSMNTFTYELKPLSDKMSTSTIDIKDLPIRDYELTCRFIEINMPVVPPLKMKLTMKYPNEPPEVLSLTSTTLNLTPAKLENSGILLILIKKLIIIIYIYFLIDGHSFFESISRNFIYFLFKLPAQHTVTDILDIWVRFFLNKNYNLIFFRVYYLANCHSKCFLNRTRIIIKKIFLFCTILYIYIHYCFLCACILSVCN